MDHFATGRVRVDRDLQPAQFLACDGVTFNRSSAADEGSCELTKEQAPAGSKLALAKAVGRGRQHPEESRWTIPHSESCWSPQVSAR